MRGQNPLDCYLLTNEYILQTKLINETVTTKSKNNKTATIVLNNNEITSTVGNMNETVTKVFFSNIFLKGSLPSEIIETGSPLNESITKASLQTNKLFESVDLLTNQLSVASFSINKSLANNSLAT